VGVFTRFARSLRRIGLGPVLFAAVPLTYETSVPPGGHGELDTPAVWVSPYGSFNLLLVTDKTEDFIEIHDPVKNLYLGRLGGSGSEPGRLARPNAVSVAYSVPSSSGPRDVMFIVERDNARVSMFLLPYGNYLGAIGTGVLNEPMGIALHWVGAQLQTWVTDIGPSPQRIQVFDVVPAASGFTGTLRKTIVAPAGAVLESIIVDPVTQRVLACDEAARNVIIYNLDGLMLGRFGVGRFTDDPEGMAIYDTGNGTGYLIVTDQVSEPMEFEVFDRQDYRWLLSFHGPTLGTDGITLVQQPLPNFPHGSFFAVHQDRSVHAYSWEDIAGTAGLCNGTPCAPVDAGLESELSAAIPAARFSNPFRPGAKVHWSLPTAASVDLSVFDARGVRVAQLVQAPLGRGVHDLAWDGRDTRGRRLPSGVYMLRLQAGAKIRSQKLTLLR
jgi:3-phytase